jgi:hypothetical protein
MGTRREAALLALLILIVAIVLAPKIGGISNPLITKTGSAAEQPRKGFMFRRIG